MQKLANGKKPGSSDRNQSDVAHLDHQAQKQNNEEKQQAFDEKDKDARHGMGIEHPGRVLP